MTEVGIRRKHGEDCQSLLSVFPLRSSDKHILDSRSHPVKMCIYTIIPLNANILNKSRETIQGTKDVSHTRDHSKIWKSDGSKWFFHSFNSCWNWIPFI